MNLFQAGDFALHSGERSPFKIECDALTLEDWQALAAIVAQRFTFGHVAGVPRGGMQLENALRRYRSPRSQRVLLVDDVLTTGGSMEDFRGGFYATDLVQGVVVFARGPVPDWITPIFTMNVAPLPRTGAR